MREHEKVSSRARMGFLKELFEKKLKSNGKEFFEEGGLEVGRTYSEYSLPQLRQQQFDSSSNRYCHVPCNHACHLNIG